jgi:sulfur carrier protein ThiS
MDVFIERKQEKLAIKFEGKASALLERIGINPEEVIVVRNGELVTLSEELSEGDEVKVLSVVSGG